jgi:hypothetical protein
MVAFRKEGAGYTNEGYQSSESIHGSTDSELSVQQTSLSHGKFNEFILITIFHIRSLIKNVFFTIRCCQLYWNIQ